MLDIIYAIKFVHMLSVAVMFGTWICIALFMLLAYRSNNTSVAAVTALFAVRAELMLMVPAVALQPLAGLPLGLAIGAQLDEYWIELSVAVYAAVVAVWLANLVIEMRIRKVTQAAALDGEPLPNSYQRMFRLWSVLSIAGLGGMTAIMALMIWQPHRY
jgi:uncharacterized membrane protein